MNEFQTNQNFLEINDASIIKPKIPRLFESDDEDENEKEEHVKMAQSDNEENINSSSAKTEPVVSVIKAKKRKTNTANEMVNDMKGDLEQDQRYEQPSSLLSGHASSLHSDAEENSSSSSSSSSGKNSNQKSFLPQTLTLIPSPPLPPLPPSSSSSLQPLISLSDMAEASSFKKPIYLSEEKTRYLKQIFEENEAPSLDERRAIADKLKMEIIVVNRWFWNRKNRIRKKSRNLDKTNGIYF